MFTLQKYFLCVKFSHEKRLCPKMAKSKFKITQFITYSNYLLKVFHTETTHSVFQTITKAAQTSEIGHKFLSVLQTTLKNTDPSCLICIKIVTLLLSYMKKKKNSNLNEKLRKFMGWICPLASCLLDHWGGQFSNFRCTCVLTSFAAVKINGSS